MLPDWLKQIAADCTDAERQQLERAMRVITISEVIGDDYVQYCISFNFDSDYDTKCCERLVDAEAFADEVNAHNGGDCKIVKPSA